MTPPADPSTLPWQIEKIDLSRIQLDRIRDNQTLFYLLTASSFIESGADLYTSNLVDYFASDPEVSAWLAQHWEHEELQHGRALRMYVQYVWPDFAWEDAFESFLQEYGKLCTAEELEPTLAQELAARCVVETGTSSLYRAINACTDEPVLREIATISAAMRSAITRISITSFFALPARTKAQPLCHFRHARPPLA